MDGLIHQDSISLDELYEYLCEFHLSDSLAFIGRINALLKYGTRQLSDALVPPEIRLWLGKIPTDHYLQIYMECSRMVRFLLLSGAHDLNEKVLSLHDHSFETAISLLRKLHDFEVEPDPVDKRWAEITFGRLSQWQFPLQADREILIGRAYLLFYVLPTELDLEYSMEVKMKEYFDIGAFEFIASGMAVWFKTNGTLDYELKIEIPYLKTIATPKNILIFRDLSSGEPRRYKKELRGENWDQTSKLLDIYFLDPLIKMPFIIVNNSKTLPRDTYLVPSAKYLLDRTSSGIFYLLGNKERDLAKIQGHTGKNPFREMFGKLYRDYVGRQLQQVGSPTVLLDLDVEFTGSKEKIPDFAVISGNTCILFEVKLSLLTLNARTFFNEADLRSDIKEGSIKKAISQLTEFRRSILSGKISHPSLWGVKAVVIVLVGYEDIFVANSALLPFLDAEYGDEIKSFQLAGISDIEAIGNGLEKAADLTGMLQDKISDSHLRFWSIVTFLEGKLGRDNKIVRSAFRSFMAHLTSGPEFKKS